MALTNTGNIQNGYVSSTTLKGTINNTGSIELAVPSGGAGGPSGFFGPTLVIGTAGTLTQVTLKGGGSIQLDALGSDYIVGGAYVGSEPTTLFNLNNEIVGTGRIGDGGLTLKNAGNITAFSDIAGFQGPLVIDTGSRTITNTGTMQAVQDSELYIASPLNNQGGKLGVVHGGQLIAAGAVSGGTAGIATGGTVEFGAASSTAVTFINAISGAGLGLILDDSQQYTGTVTGFGGVNHSNHTQYIDLGDIAYSATMQTRSFANGMLTVKDASGHSAHIKFAGSYALSNCNFADDGAGGTLLTDPGISKQTSPAGPGTMPLTSTVALLVQHMASAFTSPCTGITGGGIFGTDTAQQLLHVAPSHA